MDIATCWRCEQPGHIAAECTRPPAATAREHQDRIDRYRDRWFAGEITLDQKRAWIAAENKTHGKATAA